MKPSETLREFIARREGEVRDMIKTLKAEQAELKAVRFKLDGTDVAAREAPDGQPSGFPTIKDMIRAVIRTADMGMTSGDVILMIERDFGPTLERTSLSPQLSRLRRDGELVLDDGRWYPTDNIKLVSVTSDKKEGSDAGASEPSDGTGAGDGSRGVPSQPTAAGSIPAASTPAKKPAFYGGDFADDLDDDVPF